VPPRQWITGRSWGTVTG